MPEERDRHPFKLQIAVVTSDGVHQASNSNTVLHSHNPLQSKPAFVELHKDRLVTLISPSYIDLPSLF